MRVRHRARLRTSPRSVHTYQLFFLRFLEPLHFSFAFSCFRKSGEDFRVNDSYRQVRTRVFGAGSIVVLFLSFGQIYARSCIQRAVAAARQVEIVSFLHMWPRNRRYTILRELFWPHRLTVRTAGFQSVNRSSILRGAASFWLTEAIFSVAAYTEDGISSRTALRRMG